MPIMSYLNTKRSSSLSPSNSIFYLDGYCCSNISRHGQNRKMKEYVMNTDYIFLFQDFFGVVQTDITVLITVNLCKVNI